MEQYANSATTTLNGAINNSTTSIVVTDASLFPSIGNFRILIDSEIMLVTSVSSNTFTVSTRGTIESTSAASHLNGAAVTQALTGQSLTNLFSEGVVYDTLANLPASSRNGRLFFPSDAPGFIYHDNGSSWDRLTPSRAAKYPPFTPAGVDDEFDDNNFSGWTLVDDGTHQPTVTEKNDVASILLPGSDTSAHLHAYMKSTAVSTNDYIEMCFRAFGIYHNFPIVGLVFADGTTYNAGNQAVFYLSYSEGLVNILPYTNYNTKGTSTTFAMGDSRNGAWGVFFMRLKYNGSNSWTGLLSPDGISFLTIGTVTATCTPSAVGFAVTTSGSTSPYMWSFEYFRKSS
jgi:hypothetical protein